MIPYPHRRARSRDRGDERRYQPLQTKNAGQQRPHSYDKEKRDFGFEQDPHPHSHSFTGRHNNGKDYSIPVAGVHTIGKKSCESVTSSGRGPACNFGGSFRLNNNGSSDNEKNKKHRSKNTSTSQLSAVNARPRSRSPQDKVVDDSPEPTDVVVWSASRKFSRSNILCPLTDSEFMGVNMKDATGILRATRTKSNSVLGYHHQERQYISCGTDPAYSEPKSKVIFNVDTVCKESLELLDEFAPPSMSPTQISPSSSLASTSYSLQISLVTQQLEEIQQAQNDVLKHLGEEISKVTEENERLKKEVDLVRDQNEGLLKVVHDTTDELERMKQIFRSRGLLQLPVEAPKSDRQEDRGDKAFPSTALAPPENQQPRIHHQREQHRTNASPDRIRKEKKEPLGESDFAELSIRGVDGAGESPYKHQHTGEISSSKKARSKRAKQLVHRSESSMDELDLSILDEETKDDQSNDSVKSSSRRKHRPRHHSHTHDVHHDHEPRQRSRSRSKEKHLKPSHTFEQDEKKANHISKPVYQKDCNEDLESIHNSGGGCFRVFMCCLSNSGSRSKTDSVDDMVLQGCQE